ncbi:MAG: hypothetical protein JSS66_10210 [Armatimonadetes bacterium]|nr:hypothetical protein [Armatimonadota bacterium]
MRVLVLEENLIWSERLRRGIVALGHEATVLTSPPTALEADVAIVNLGSRAFPSQEWIAKLRALGIKVVAHAGHKEKPLLEAANEYGADLVVTNSELTHKLESVLGRISALSH